METANTFRPDETLRKNSGEGIKIINFQLLNNIPKTGDELVFLYEIVNDSGEDKEVEIAINFKTTNEVPLLQLFSKDVGKSIILKKGLNKVQLRKKDFPLVEGDYLSTLWVGSNNTYIDWVPNCMILHMENGKLENVINENRGFPFIGTSIWEVL